MSWKVSEQSLCESHPYRDVRLADPVIRVVGVEIANLSYVMQYRIEGRGHVTLLD